MGVFLNESCYLCVAENTGDQSHISPHVGLLRRVQVLRQADTLEKEDNSHHPVGVVTLMLRNGGDVVARGKGRVQELRHTAAVRRGGPVSRHVLIQSLPRMPNPIIRIRRVDQRHQRPVCSQVSVF